MSFIRYPGGKSKFKTQILRELSPYFGSSDEYREPFFGGGSIGFEILTTAHKVKSFWINDKDIGMYCLWRAVKEFPTELKASVNGLAPSVEEFDAIRAYLQNPTASTAADIVQVGFSKLAVHQMSFSGLGLKSGGPQGGRKQNANTKYPIDCRWSAPYMCKKIDRYSALMNACASFKIDNGDFEDLITDQSNSALLYLDPPYYVKGDDLYIHSFDYSHHVRLAAALKITPHRWVLSYDDCPEVRKLYDWAFIREFNGTYSIKQTAGAVNTKTELLIMPRDMGEATDMTSYGFPD